MYEVEITDSQEFVALEAAFLREVVSRTLACEQVRAARISVAVVDNAVIRDLNRKYLDHDFATDVLSFPFDCDDPSEPTGSLGRGSGKRLEGEVVVSSEMASQKAADFHWRPQDELVLYLVHGLLHLVGYDDSTDAEQSLMRSRERAILQLWQLAPRYASSEEDQTPCERPSPADGMAGADS
jgi:probable rRNA maturation factor